MDTVGKKIQLVMAAVGLSAVTLSATATTLQAEQCWVRLMPSHLPSAGYLVVHNTATEPVQLLSASSPSYDEVMLHETVEVDGMAKMQMVDKITVPAQGSLNFVPGGLHLMYEQPTATLEVGDTLQLQLVFTNNQQLQVECKVNAAKARTFE